MTFTDEDLNSLKASMAKTAPFYFSAPYETVEALLARLEAAESALDSYDRLYHAYDDESLDEYKQWLKSKGEGAGK